MAKDKYREQTDDKDMISYIMRQDKMRALVEVGSDKEKQKALVFNGVSLKQKASELFEEGRWPNCLQNQMLLTMIYACSGQDKYIDGMLTGLLDDITADPPKDRAAQNALLAKHMGNMNLYSPFSEKIEGLFSFMDFCLTSNNSVLEQTEPGKALILPSMEEKIKNHGKDEAIGREFRELKEIMTSNGWDFDNNADDLEILRMMFTLKAADNIYFQDVFENFKEKALNTKIYNIADKQQFLNDIAGTMDADNDFMKYTVKFIGDTMERNKPDVEKTRNMTAQTTDLFTIITEINKTVNKRGVLEGQKGFNESDDAFYNSDFVTQTDFKNADKNFDAIFAPLMKQQMVLSAKAEEMNELDLICNTFKIIKEGRSKPMDLKAEVAKKLKDSGRLLDENEAGIFDSEKESRRFQNEKKMAALAKVYILHELQNKNTKLFYEPYFVNEQYTRNDPVAEYLDLNHPKRIRVSDLDANKVQHDTQLLGKYGEEAGMLYAENYHAEVMQAYENGQYLKIRDDKQKMGAYSMSDVRDALEANGWNFGRSPKDANYLTMLFNAYDPMSRGCHAIERCTKKMLDTKINGLYSRNELLRDIYQELRGYREDRTINAICDYLLRDLKDTADLEISDKIDNAPYTPATSADYRITGLSSNELLDAMHQNGWSLDIRVRNLVNKLYDAYESNKPFSEAIEYGINALANVPANVSADEMNRIYVNMRNGLSLSRGEHGVEELDSYLFDLSCEAIAIRDRRDQIESAKQAMNSFSFGGGIYDTSMPEEIVRPDEPKGSIYSVSNVNIRNVTAEKQNDIEIMHGQANDDFDDFEFDASAFELEDRSDPQFLKKAERGVDEYTERKNFVEDCNTLRFMRREYLIELEEMKKKLLGTDRQKGKELGGKGTGSASYINMAKALESCITAFSDPNMSADKVMEALDAFESSSAKYFTDHKSILGKKGEGAVRLDASKKGASRAFNMKEAYSAQLDRIKVSGTGVRIKVDASAMSEKDAVLECGKLLRVTKEADIPLQTDKEMNKSLSLLEKRADVLRKIQSLSGGKLVFGNTDGERLIDAPDKKMKPVDFARNHILKQYAADVIAASSDLGKLTQLEADLNADDLAESAAMLAKNKPFIAVTKRDPENYSKAWNNIRRHSREVEFANKSFLDSIVSTHGELGNYVFDVPDQPDAQAKKYGKLANIVVAQIISSDREYAEGLSVTANGSDAAEKRLKDNLTKKVAEYLSEKKILNGCSAKKLTTKLKNGDIMRKVIAIASAKQDAASLDAVGKKAPGKTSAPSRSK